MTNGELFFKTFPCLEQDEQWSNLLWWTDEKGKRQLLGDVYDSDFWNAEYKESTTKNDLGVDCISRQEVLRLLVNSIGKTNTYLQTEVLRMSSVTPQESRKGEWLRMSDLSEQEDDRYKCSRCGNVIHHKNKMDLYTFNSWCGRCGSDNGRCINYGVEE